MLDSLLIVAYLLATLGLLALYVFLPTLLITAFFAWIAQKIFLTPQERTSFWKGLLQESRRSLKRERKK